MSIQGAVNNTVGTITGTAVGAAVLQEKVAKDIEKEQSIINTARESISEKENAVNKDIKLNKDNMVNNLNDQNIYRMAHDEAKEKFNSIQKDDNGMYRYHGKFSSNKERMAARFDMLRYSNANYGLMEEYKTMQKQAQDFQNRLASLGNEKSALDTKEQALHKKANRLGVKI